MIQKQIQKLAIKRMKKDFIKQYGAYDGYRIWLTFVQMYHFEQAPMELKRRACELHDENAKIELDKFCCQNFSDKDLEAIRNTPVDKMMKYQRICIAKVAPERLRDYDEVVANL